jgi:tRNA-(ms[2]io[6]A)-hydroxylase
MTVDISPIDQFLNVATPQGWIDAALQNLDILLIDHAQCEKKAASTALMMIHRYPDREELLNKLSRLAREELRHFEQVLDIMKSRGVKYQALSAARYARTLREQVRHQEPHRLIDTLIIGAIIEARSCERFAALAPFLDEELAKYYRFLLKSESRHFKDYLALAEEYSGADISNRVNYFLQIENELIISSDKQFRFHSGVPENY